jgi:glutamate dehydrogenase/leucine dehydrogenase
VDVFDSITTTGHEQVVFGHDRATGLRAIVAIHDTMLGPALGIR